ncbi:MAG: phosphatase PAP2 family protein [Thermoleophilaceae bacterium]
MRRGPITLSILVLAFGLLAGGCGSSSDDGPGSSPPVEPAAGTWKTWVLSSPGEIRVPPPPRPGSPADERDEQRLRAAVANRTASEERAVREFGTDPAVQPWLERAMAFVAQRAKDPPAASRAYALVSVAMADATTAAWHWKYRYKRGAPGGESITARAPDPSYPSEHAAIAGAASRVLEYAFENQPKPRLEEEAEDAARARVLAGASRPSDAQAGLELGRRVAERVIARARRDGFTREWDGSRPRGFGTWQPPPGSVARPVQPLAGSWRTWVIEDGSQFRAPKPPKLDSPELRAEARELIRIRERLTPEQKRIAKFWEGGEGTALPPGIWNQVMLPYVGRRNMSTPAAARVFALLNVAMADAGTASWDSKYAYWLARPENGIRALGLDPRWKPYLQTPLFPAYVSGHSTYSAAAGEILAHLFPEDAKAWRGRGREAGISRLYGGIHWRIDHVEGARIGKRVGRLVAERAENDGAER